MKSTIRLTIIIGIFYMAIGSVSAGVPGILVFEMGGVSSGPSDSIGNSSLYQDKELEAFYTAKKHIYESNYSAALTGFDKFLNKFPDGRFRDEAHYWSAYALNKLSQAQDHTYVMVTLKEQAFDHLIQLIREHPTSNWADDAKVMRLEIAGELILMGKDTYLQYIEETLSTKNDWSSDLKLHALDSLMRVRKEAALPILTELVEEDKAPEVRKKAVFLLGKHFDQEAIEILNQVSKHDQSEDVRKEANLWLDQIEMQLMPVRLNTSVFGGRLKEGCQLTQVPEDQLTSFSLPTSIPRAKKEMTGFIEVFFDNEVEVDPEVQRIMTNVGINISTDKLQLAQPLRSSEPLRLAQPLLLGQSVSIDGTPFPNFDVSFIANGFLVQVLNREVVREPDRISGKVLFQDQKKNGKKYYAAFTVDEKSDRLIAIRRGSDMAMTVVQFESTGKLTERTKPILGKPIYRTVFTNVYGTIIHSSRGSWPGDEMSLSADTTDFGQAKAEIPGQGGTWILEGFITMDKKNKNFLARLAKLTDPEGKTVVQADEIIVPIKKPEDYKVTRKNN